MELMDGLEAKLDVAGQNLERQGRARPRVGQLRPDREGWPSLSFLRIQAFLACDWSLVGLVCLGLLDSAITE